MTLENIRFFHIFFLFMINLLSIRSRLFFLHDDLLFFRKNIKMIAFLLALLWKQVFAFFNSSSLFIFLILTSLLCWFFTSSFILFRWWAVLLRIIFLLLDFIYLLDFLLFIFDYVDNFICEIFRELLAT